MNYTLPHWCTEAGIVHDSVARRVVVVRHAHVYRREGSLAAALIRHIDSHYGEASRRRMAALMERLKTVIADAKEAKAREAATKPS